MSSSKIYPPKKESYSEDIFERIVESLTENGEADLNGGAQTKRFSWGSYVLKVQRSEKSLCSEDVISDNVEVLEEINIPLIGSTYRDVSGGKVTAILQEEVDRTFMDTVEDGESTQYTEDLLEGATKITDLAYENDIKLDNSLRNFGFSGTEVGFLDYHDENSVETDPSQEDLDSMYDTLVTSARQVMPKEKAEQTVERSSDYANLAWTRSKMRA